MSIKRTTCPFCRNGCESGVSFDGYQYRMEYLADSQVNKGRLCPRGNSANLVIDHPKRLGYPLLDGKEVTWERAIGLIKSWLGAVEPGELAIVYGRGRSGDEIRLVTGFAKALGTQNLVCGHIEPENSFFFRLDQTRDATLDEVRTARAMLLVGDVFSTSPVAAGPIIEARYADRKNRLVVIDSIRTRQAGFAHLFIQTRPGTEVFALMALAALLDNSLAGIDIDKFCGIAGVERKQLEAAAKMLAPGNVGFVGSAMHLGRVSYPRLHSLASQLVAVKAGKPFVGFGEARMPQGLMSFAQLRQAVSDGRIKMMFWLGGLYPYSYPELFPEMGKVQYRVATSIFRPELPLPGLVLPIPSELEKESTTHSYWSEVNRHPVAAPYSGTKSVPWILGRIAQADEIAEQTMIPVSVEEVVKMAGKMAEAGPVEQPEWLLVGEKKAIGIGGFYDAEERISISPTDARKLDVTEENRLVVESPCGKAELAVYITDAVMAGVLSIGVNAHKNRALFPIRTCHGTGETAVPPVGVKVEKSEMMARPAPETAENG